MLPRNHTHRIRVSFDDHRLVANAGLILPAVLASGDCIDTVDVLRTGGTACSLGCVPKAPSTLGTFLPSFRQTGPFSRGRPLLMAEREVESNIGNLPAGGAQTASV